jgi:hypothetical protein
MHMNTAVGDTEHESTAIVLIGRVVGGNTSIGTLSAETIQSGDHLIAIDSKPVSTMFHIDNVKRAIIEQAVSHVELEIYRPSTCFQFVVLVPRPQPRRPLTPCATSSVHRSYPSTENQSSPPPLPPRPPPEVQKRGLAVTAAADWQQHDVQAHGGRPHSMPTQNSEVNTSACI